MPAIIDETVLTGTKADPISVPIGADNRTAESLLDAWTAIARRFKFIEAFYDVMKVLTLGGTLTTADSVTWTLANGKVLTFASGGAALVSFLASVKVRFEGNAVGKLFTAGTEGYANKKILKVAGGSGDFTLDSIGYDMCILTSGIAGARTAVLSIPAAGLDGLQMRIVNQSPTYFTSYKQSGGATMGNDLKYTAGQMFSVDLVWVEADGTWQITGYGAYSP